MKKLTLITLFSILLTQTSHAFTSGVYKVTVEKQKQKESSRWTLLGWLGKKKKMALMDQWLALNSKSSLFEVILDYNKGNFDQSFPESSNQESEESVESYSAALYIKFLGLQYIKKKASRDNFITDYRLNLLLLGSSVQSTHLQLFAGQRTLDQRLNQLKFKQNYFGLSSALYLLGPIGVTGSYRNYGEATSEQISTVKAKGSYHSYGAFLEYSILRVYLDKFSEKLEYLPSNTEVENDGYVLGVKLFL